MIANRGEISCRIAQTARKMKILVTAVYSNHDRNSLHIHQADEAINLGDSPLADSYLNKHKIIEAALQCGADAVHPGYGFLSENPEFAQLCVENGLIFIGPPASAIRDMGIKSLSKQLMSQANVPVVPGYHEDNQDDSFLALKAKEIGFPVMIKAVKGGGGKGMRTSINENDFLNQLQSARRESLKSFDDDSVLIEKLIQNPRHIEVQIFSDLYQNCVHLFERDCSVQRRHQKIIEEAPGPGINESTRKELGKAAVAAAKAVNYVGAGTVEFIYDNSNNKFYFMEMNTRIQVEHTVTEMITGIDLVEWQIRVACGEPLPLTQEEIKLNGHSFEARVYLEDPENNFLPCVGTLNKIIFPKTGKNVRVETAVTSGSNVSVHYDPMIAKLVVWSSNRNSALVELKHCLRNFNIVGPKTNINFLHRIASHSKFVQGKICTNFIEDYKKDLLLKRNDPSHFEIAAAVVGYYLSIVKKYFGSRKSSNYDSFRNNKAGNYKQSLIFSENNKDYEVVLIDEGSQAFQIQIDKQTINISSASLDSDHKLIIENQNRQVAFRLIVHQNKIGLFSDQNDAFYFEHKLKPNFESNNDTNGQELKAISPMSGVIEKVLVEEGQQVKQFQSLIIMMSMKMEFIITSNEEATIDKIFYKKGDYVQKGSTLIKLKSHRC